MDLRVEEKICWSSGEIVTAAIHHDDNGFIKDTNTGRVKTEAEYLDEGRMTIHREMAPGYWVESRMGMNLNGWKTEEITTETNGNKIIYRCKDFYANGAPREETIENIYAKMTDYRRNEYFPLGTMNLSKVVAKRSNQGSMGGESTAEYGHDANLRVNGKLNSIDEYENAFTSLMTTTDGSVRNKECLFNGGNRHANYLRSVNDKLLGGYINGYWEKDYFPWPDILLGGASKIGRI